MAVLGGKAFAMELAKFGNTMILSGPISGS